MPVTRFEDLDLNRQYTYADYLTWQFRERVELLRGWVARMSPAPNRYHQDVSRNVELALLGYFTGRDCKVYDAPFDVRLPRTDGGETVVQPDLCVICDPTKLTKQGCTGAPDWIVEILSPGNSNREMREKYELYEESGVREYWVVDPANQMVLRYLLGDDGTYVGLRPFTRVAEAIPSAAFPDFAIAGETVFRE